MPQLGSPYIDGNIPLLVEIPHFSVDGKTGTLFKIIVKFLGSDRASAFGDDYVAVHIYRLDRTGSQESFACLFTAELDSIGTVENNGVISLKFQHRAFFVLFLPDIKSAGDRSGARTIGRNR